MVKEEIRGMAKVNVFYISLLGFSRYVYEYAQNLSKILVPL